MKTKDPLAFKKKFWPHVTFYKQQREIIYSVRDNVETTVHAGNMLGKDFVTAFIILWFLMTRQPCRIVTTSVKDDHLRVLWGEINNFIRESKHAMDSRDGGPLVINQREIKRIGDGPGGLEPKTYVKGMVAENPVSLQGHHIARTGDGIPRTLAVGDEASGLDDETRTMMDGWAHRMLWIGNPWPCENFFKYAIKGRPGTNDNGGDIPNEYGEGLYRKVIKITAKDSPNIRWALKEIGEGKEPSNRIMVPGVKPYDTYVRNLATWTEVQKCVGLDAEFHEGPDTLMFPPMWLDAAERRSKELKGTPRRAKTMGIDPAEGGDNSTWAIADPFGLIELISKKTPNTSDIMGETLRLMRDHHLKPEQIYFDRGGGGRQHADYMREAGYKVNTVAFGESVMPEKRRGGLTPLETRKEQDEERYIYKRRRDQMYHMLSLLLNPDNPLTTRNKAGEVVGGFGLSHEELRYQLSKIPMLYDPEGRIYLPSKNKRSKDSTEVTLTELIGHSPDEADALVLAVYGMQKKVRRAKVGAW